MGGLTWIFVVGLIALAIRVVVVVRRVNARMSKQLDNLDLRAIRAHLNWLMQSREPSAYVIFEDLTSKGSERWMRAERFIQFAKADGPGGASLTCHFPKAQWSAPYTGPLRALLESRQTPFTEIPAGPDEEIAGFIVVNRLSPSAATELVDIVFRQVFGCAEIRARVWGLGVRPGDRTGSLNLLAEILERLPTTSRTEAEALVLALPEDLHPDARAVVANVWHYLADYDIRGRDESYARSQEQDLRDLIAALRRGDSREDLLSYSLIG